MNWKEKAEYDAKVKALDNAIKMANERIEKTKKEINTLITPKSVKLAKDISVPINANEIMRKEADQKRADLKKAQDDRAVWAYQRNNPNSLFMSKEEEYTFLKDTYRELLNAAKIANIKLTDSTLKAKLKKAAKDMGLTAYDSVIQNLIDDMKPKKRNLGPIDGE